MTYHDVYSIQQWNEEHRAQITRSFVDSRADEAQLRFIAGQVISWLGTRFVRWGQQLQHNGNYERYVRTDA